MNIREFTEKIQAALTVSLNKEVQLKETLKLNNIRRYGIVIVESENSLSPIIYLEKLFEDFQNGKSMNAVLNIVNDIYLRDRHLPVLGERISTTRSGAPCTPSALIFSRSQTTIRSGL